MLYLDFAINREELLTEKQRSLPKICRRFLYFIKRSTGHVRKYKIENNTVIVLSKINKKSLNKINKILRINVEKNICVCDYLLENKEFMKYLNQMNLNIIDGRWLFKYMMLDIAKYICKELNVSIETQNISILTNENDTFIFESINRLAQNVKNINIITRTPNKFKVLEEKLYKEYGLIVHITNNFKKSVLNSNIIFNLNFVQEDLDKINFNKNCVIVNFDENLKINQKNFNGINSSFFSVSLPERYKEIYKKLYHFNIVNLYESLIYKKTLIKNIWKEIEDDNIEVKCLEDDKGIVKFKPFLISERKVVN